MVSSFESTILFYLLEVGKKSSTENYQKIPQVLYELYIFCVKYLLQTFYNPFLIQ